MNFQNYYSPDLNLNQLLYVNFPPNYGSFSSHLLQQIIYQNQLLKSQNKELTLKLQVVEAEKEKIRQENNSMKASRASVLNRVKRNYSKRRTWLQKKYVCPSSGCHNKYSSMIALNLHIRKHHLVDNQE